uniref:Ionotropic glutamate receptor C-terminal domain-containing protein n=1 Tax=Timema monikensis TaxID=170555 RepID=A0A7R9EL33_9NEOP|nr:unnamed protein product [Timema monikensis]
MPSCLYHTEFSQQQLWHRTKFIFRKPPLSLVSNVYILPFSTGVWLSSSCLVIICGGLLYAALRWERRRNKGVSEDQDLEEYIRALGVDKEVSWSDVVLLSLGAVCQQGSTTESTGTPGRIISLLMFIAVVFLYTSYSANIVALLQSTTDSISSLENLLYSRIELGADDNYVNRYYFQNATDPLRKAIYEKKIASPGVKPRFYSVKEGMEKLRKDFFAFHVEESLAFMFMSETYTEDEKCGLGSIPGYLQVTDPWVAVRKDTPYKEMFKMW